MSFPLASDANAGRVVVITGGGTGIGKATALAFARTGARVAICGRREERLASARVEIEAAGAQDAGVECLSMSCDVREPEQVAAFLDAVMDRFGRIDSLVNNAGGQFTAPAEEISAKGWRAVHRLTEDAAWEMTREAATRSMIPRRSGFIAFLGFSPRRGILHPFGRRHPDEPRGRGWRTSRRASRSSGAVTASAPSASFPARSRRRVSQATARGPWRPRAGRSRSDGSGRPRRSEP